MNSTVVLLLVAVVAMSGFAQKRKQPAPPSEVEITAEPNHHLAFQNSYVRVFQVDVASHSATLLHRHRHDYIFVTLGASQISNEVQGKSPVTLKLQDGEARFTAGNFAHLARNLAMTPFRNVTIELLRDQQAENAQQKWEENRGLHVLHGGTQEILFVKDGVRVSEIELQTAGVLPKHSHHRPQLVVAVTDFVFRNDVTGEPASNIEMKSGDVRWEDAGFTHTVTNVGQQTAKIVTLDF